MKVLYIFSTPNASYILNDMILPQLEAGTHPVEVVGMFFFVDHGSSASPAIQGGVSEAKRRPGAAGPAQTRGEEAPPFQGGVTHNNYLLLRGNPTAQRLARLTEEGRIGFLMGCDQCCYARGIADRLEPPAVIGCFPNLYARAGQAGMEQAITL